jgi:putative CocE/NonD family hydrolase
MPDGARLLADHYAPQGIGKSPVVLIRSPYGKSRAFGFGMARPLARQGYQVLLQCCRGTHGSSGVFDPHHDEQRDGLATLEWIKLQPWYGGAVATFGPSYLGYTQWALAEAAGPEVRAMAMQVTLAHFAQMTYAGHSLMLHNALSWTHMMSRMQRPLYLFIMMASMLLRLDMVPAKKWRELPLQTLDETAVGQRVSFWRDWMQHDHADDPWWTPMDFHRTITHVKRPITMVTGWFDIFLPWQLQDFARLQQAGCPCRITIGPWGHTHAQLGQVAMRDAIDWFKRHLSSDTPAADERAPVRLYIVGADTWREFDRWPPPGIRTEHCYLQAGGALATSTPESAPPDRYRYDPDDPTPSVGGPSLLPPRPFSVDNHRLESRADVLSYTSEALPADVDVVGPVAAQIYAQADVASVDLFVRLCDVDSTGRSFNVCDGLQRVSVESSDAPQAVLIRLWPTAHRFKAGHRFRVQVSSGAFPRWARNPGSGAPLASAATLAVANVAVHHGPACPSRLSLSVLTGSA